jgi:hypothetical protein
LEQQDLERIARLALRELGLPGVQITVAPSADHPGQWNIEFPGQHGTSRLKIKCGAGSSPQWVRDQIFEQYLAQN